MRVTGDSIQRGDLSGAQSGKKPDKAGKTEGAKEAKDAKKVEGKAVSPAASDSAKVDVSSRAKEAAKAKDVADKTPDVREDKVAELKARIAAGKYNVDADALADRLYEEHLKTNIG